MLNRKQKEITKAFAVTPTALRAMLDAVVTADDDVSILVKCRDGSELRPESLEEILRLPNPSSRAIERMSLRVNRGMTLNIEIDFMNDHMTPISYAVSGQDLEVLQVSQTLDDHLEPMIQRYSLMCVFPSNLYLVMTALLCGSLLLGVALGRIFAKGPTVASNVMLATSIGLVTLSAIYGTIRRNIFPVGSFRIGDGEERFQRSVSARKQLGPALILALIMGIIASVVANKISH